MAEGRGPSRRALLGGAGVVVGAAALAGGGFAAGRATASPVQLRQYDFHGEHQSGIVTPAQDRMHFAAFDVTTGSRDELIALLRSWTQGAAVLMTGTELGDGAAGGSPLAPPDDTGDATGLPASGLTITFGFGPSLFSKDGEDRFGIADRQPSQLADLPHFAGDTLEDRLTGGDLCIQACADDPQVAMHAIRNLSRLAFGVASVRWAQLGFGRTSSTTRDQTTPRNLMGFKDGTRNLRAEDTDNVARWLWADAADGQEWMAGGTYLVARKLRILAEVWDRASLSEQEATVGRAKGSGAPLSGGNEFTDPDYGRPGADGTPLIPTDSHIALAHPEANGGAMMLRRGYNYTDGADDLGRLDAGLFFLAYVRDPETQYIPMQNAISSKDAMTVEYVRAVGSAMFAVPPGIAAGATLGGDDGAYVGQGLFG
ncbi:iron uptake transporter deferrochelatase/peroxidase subunit [Demequina capsici]|uniref:Deferrochelatase n=1 Tax=Demequina capsici TaxID=3075620 RepID=A0AA96F8I6_9MICO|nr:iron uptake transporter deferrochelatase/peroxidase subunit [Demequina sp. OYTSA14]WNM25148.1 iron uptake transporter deferrochelatase/peroxidase subunit [Demequina sp. OYTSA14]